MGLMNMFGNQREQIEQIRNDPLGMAQKAGFNIPQELAEDPKGMVMHLISSGQVSNPMMQKIMPMIRMMNGK